MLTQEELQLMEERIAQNADALIALGAKEWQKRKKKARYGQEEQVRRIEESLVTDKVGN